MLLLEGAQAGLSWATILNKRDNYRRALDGFDPERIAGYDEAKLAALLADPGIVRNRLKVAGTVRNARAFLATQQQHGSFASYLWAWVDGTPVRNRPALHRRPARPDRAVRPAQQGPEAARLHVRRVHHQCTATCRPSGWSTTT